MNSQRPAMLSRKNNSISKRGRKPILSNANLKKVNKQANGIKTVLRSAGSAALTAAARSVIGSIFGSGDYTVKYNSLSGVGGPPQFSSNGNSRSTVVAHREYVGDITGSTAFSSSRYTITPTNSSLFPWLSQVAENYEEYRIHGMIFEFKTTSGASVSSTNTALGTVVMATQYNPNDVPFISKIEMENYEFGTSGAPFENFLHPLECKPSLTVAPQLYVDQPNTGTVDLRLTDFGAFTIATVGMQTSNVIGELWVSYQVELLKPRLSNQLQSIGQVLIYYNSGVSTTAPFGANGNTPAQITNLNTTSGGPSIFFTPSTFVTNTPTPNGLNLSTSGTSGLITLPTSVRWEKRAVMITYSCVCVSPTATPTWSFNTGTTGSGPQNGTANSGFGGNTSWFSFVFYFTSYTTPSPQILISMNGLAASLSTAVLDINLIF